MTTWRVWCPICRVHRQTRIPARADTRVVTADYESHMRLHVKSKRVESDGK